MATQSKLKMPEKEKRLTKLSKNDLVSAVNEFNSKLNLNPQINQHDSPGKVERKLKDVVEMVEENDNLTEVTVRVRTELVVKGFYKPKEDKKEGTKTKTSKPKVTKGPGVIATIAGTLEVDEKEAITKEEIHSVLVKTFPDRNAASMLSTINVQVPSRITKERFKVLKTKDGRYYKG